MRLKPFGEKGKRVKVLGVGANGVTLEIEGKPYKMPYKEFPWLRHLTASELTGFYARHGREIVQYELGIELSLDSIENPEKYPNLMDPILAELGDFPRDTQAFEAIAVARDSLEALPQNVADQVIEAQKIANKPFKTALSGVNKRIRPKKHGNKRTKAAG